VRVTKEKQDGVYTYEDAGIRHGRCHRELTRSRGIMFFLFYRANYKSQSGHSIYQSTCQSSHRHQSRENQEAQRNIEREQKAEPSYNHHPPNHRDGGLRVGLAFRTTVTVLRPSAPSMSSSVMMSIAVVRGLPDVDGELKTCGVGRRVLAGDGTVMVCVTVWVSYVVPGTKAGRAWRWTNDMSASEHFHRAENTEDQPKKIIL
jgi:hypothetical protein